MRMKFMAFWIVMTMVEVGAERGTTAAPTPNPKPERYALTQLDAADPRFRSGAQMISEDGVVAGQSGEPGYNGFAWSTDTGWVDLTLGGTQSLASGISPNGIVTGASFLPGDDVVHGFIWTVADGILDIGGLGGPETVPQSYGTVTVTDQLGGADVETFVITMRRFQQQIRFTALPDVTYGQAPYFFVATGGASGQPVVFAVTGTPAVCSIESANSRAVLTVLQAGTCSVTATQARTADYDAAPPVEHSFEVRPAPLTITASTATMTYGATVPAITPGFDGFSAATAPRLWTCRQRAVQQSPRARTSASTTPPAAEPLIPTTP
ncbi:MAG: hypothetical protein ABIX28_24135 [Vicinamibacterales bacterium]